jgi:hypothetical protein
MRKTSYSLPKSIGLIFTKAFASSSYGNNHNLIKISKERFFNYCLAVYLFAWLKYNDLFSDLIKGPPGLREDNIENLDSLTGENLFVEDSEGKQPNLVGLTCPDFLQENTAEQYYISKDSMAELELLLNDYFRYHCLRKVYKKNQVVSDEYQTVVSRFEPLRQKFGIPLRLEYNKFAQRDNTESTNGIVVEIRPRVKDQVEKAEPTEPTLNSSSSAAEVSIDKADVNLDTDAVLE